MRNESGYSSGGALASRDFTRLAAFIHSYAGIKMPPVKKTLVEGRLRRRVSALGMDSLSEYCRYLFDEDGLEQEVVHLIDAVTTNKTDFFREPQHFNFLIKRALPQLVEDGQVDPEHPVRAWSAASSTGAEAYTIAMVLAEFARQQRGLGFSIFATDICTEVLRKGLRAVYGEEEIRPVPRALQQRYLMFAKDPERREIRVVPALRRRVQFSQLNLMDDSYPMPKDMELIFCRNVLIYFDKATQQKVLERLCRHLRPGGYLFVGHAEALSGHDLPLTPVANAVFVRNAG